MTSTFTGKETTVKASGGSTTKSSVESTTYKVFFFNINIF